MKGQSVRLTAALTAQPVRLSDFAGLVDVAMIAFATDERYAVRMARRAVNIQRTRQRVADRAQQRADLVAAQAALDI